MNVFIFANNLFLTDTVLNLRYKEMMHSLKNSMMVVVESMIDKFEEDEMRSRERQRKIQKEKSNSYCTDNCSDSDSSSNQVCGLVLHLCFEMVFNKHELQCMLY